VSLAPRDDKPLLLALLNTTPTVDGQRRDLLADDDAARRWLADQVGEPPADTDLDRLRETRGTLQRVVLDEADPRELAPVLADVVSRPAMGEHGVTWRFEAPPSVELPARAVLAWDAVNRTAPGRLRHCDNPDCSLFLIDRSTSGNARWCSMSTCGNRMKARRHHRRSRTGRDDADV
jgi:predicted RNA-binding Zn ribbon-like protein